MSRPMVWGVVPVKPFRFAKQRLRPLLTSEERCELARVMFEDVLDALLSSTSLAGVLVVTSEWAAADLSERSGAAVLKEEGPVGMNEAVHRAIGWLGTVRDAGSIVVPADLPQLSPLVVDAVAADLVQPRAVTIVPAALDGGTNLLACRPIGLVPPSFGVESFDRHCRAAALAGLTARVRVWPAMQRDIDQPRDLLDFVALHTETRTDAYARALDLPRRYREAQAHDWRAGALGWSLDVEGVRP